MENLKIATPPIKEETFGSPMRVTKKSWEGIQSEPPTMGKKNISYIEVGTLWGRMLIFWWDLFMLPTLRAGWLSELGFFTCSHWLSPHPEMKEVVKLLQVFFCKLCQGPWISFVNVSWHFRMNPGKNCRKSGDDDEACAGWIQEVRGAGKTLVATELALWDSENQLFRCEDLNWKVSPSDCGFVSCHCLLKRCCRRRCSTIYPPTPPKKKENRYVVHGISKVGWEIWMFFLSVGKYQTGK